MTEFSMFEHYKGGQYEFRGFGIDGSTGETVVLYQTLSGDDDGPIFSRKASEFFGFVEVGVGDKTWKPRFKLLAPSKP